MPRDADGARRRDRPPTCRLCCPMFVRTGAILDLKPAAGARSDQNRNFDAVAAAGPLLERPAHAFPAPRRRRRAIVGRPRPTGRTEGEQAAARKRRSAAHEGLPHAKKAVYGQIFAVQRHPRGAEQFGDARHLDCPAVVSQRRVENADLAAFQHERHRLVLARQLRVPRGQNFDRPIADQADIKLVVGLEIAQSWRHDRMRAA